MLTMSTTTDFLSLVEASQLLSAAQLSKYYQTDASDEQPLAVATRLVRDGLLTQFQAKVLLKGKPQSFFLTPKYKILDHLGTGGMGRVYLCEHMILERLVAFKIPTETRPRLETPPRARVIERFYREARAVKGSTTGTLFESSMLSRLRARSW